MKKKNNEMIPMKHTVLIIGKQNRILCPLKVIFKDESKIQTFLKNKNSQMTLKAQLI